MHSRSTDCDRVASGGRQPGGVYLCAPARRRSNRGLTPPARRRVRDRAARLVNLHRDERGTISLLTVVTVIGLMLVLGMVINVGRHIDDKVKMQNAADAAAYSGGVVLARGMNALSFSNHLLCDVFALTAFMREARDRNAESMVPEILDAWATIGPIFSKSEFPKFRSLGQAITHKVPLEQELVRSYSDMSAATSKLVLPVFEYVLSERLIPEFQRAVVQTLPHVAQQATNEVARRHGLKPPQRKQVGVLWRTRAEAVGYPDERDPVTRTLPAIDPEPGQSGNAPDAVPDPHPDPLAGADFDFQAIPNGADYLARATQQRDHLARVYLEQWTADRLRFFAAEAKMSQFINLWRVFTCGQLDRLLAEYPSSNLPHVMRLLEGGRDAETLRVSEDVYAIDQYLDTNFMFLGVVYRPQFKETFPGFFRNPLESDPLTFAQVHLFIPRPRMVRMSGQGGGSGTSSATDSNIGGGLGIDVSIPQPAADPGHGGAGGQGTDDWLTEGWPPHWDLLNQNWTVQLVPSTTARLAQILQTKPPDLALSQPLTVKLPRLGSATSQTLRNLNGH
ncbi:MAG: hypothetical protein EXS05_18775 [Planctomycetaceae bacterium]|nr:hypothetical protein [Planctomycetaceae bacterium]